jgi:hypothetical protein
MHFLIYLGTLFFIMNIISDNISLFFNHDKSQRMLSYLKLFNFINILLYNNRLYKYTRKFTIIEIRHFSSLKEILN